jgi:hypothetical protein
MSPIATLSVTLEQECRRGDVVRGERSDDGVDEPGCGDLPARDVHRDARLGQRPGAQLGDEADRLPEHDLTELEDQPGLLRDRDEVGRLDETTLRVVPPGQGLRA